MFKLVKILGSNSNVPEPIKIDVDVSNNLEAGCIYYIDNCSIIAEPGNWYAPMVCALQDVIISDCTVTGLCFFITPDMIFETTVANAGDIVYSGAPFKLVFGSQHHGVSISTSVGEGQNVVGIIVNADSYKSTGKVLVKFHCTKGEKE